MLTMRQLFAIVCFSAHVLAVLAASIQADCGADHVALIKQQITDSVYFCQYYGSAPRNNSPIAGLSATQVTATCKCILTRNNRRPIPPASTKGALPSGQFSCSQRDYQVLQQAVTDPKAFCGFFGKTPRAYSFLPKLSVSNVLKACACAKSKPTASASKMPKTSTRTTAGQKSTRTSTQAAPTATLKPYVPKQIDGKNLTLLKPANTTAAYYGAANTGNSSTATLAQVNLGLQYLSINLDHSSYVAVVACNEAHTTINITFNAKTAFITSENAWKAAKELILVTSSNSCGTGEHSALFLARQFSFVPLSLTIQATGSIVQLSDVYSNVGVDFGTIQLPTSANSSHATSSTAVCATPVPTGTVSPACFDDFDAALDKKLGFYSATAEDASYVFSQVAPGIGTPLQTRGGPLLRRCVIACSAISAFKSDCKSAVSYVTSKATSAYSAVTSFAKTEAKSAEKEVGNISGSIKGALAAGLAKLESGLASLVGTHSGKLGVSMNIAPGTHSLSPSPWGQQYLLSSLAVPSQAKKPNSTNDDGNDVGDGLQDYAGIEMFCVNCGIEGEFELTGTVGISALHGVTAASISLTGNLYAGIFLGAYANAQLEKNFTSNIPSIPLAIFVIKDVITITPEVSLNIELDLKIDAVAEVMVGAALTWPSVSGNLDFLNSANSWASGFTPTLDNSFDANGTVAMKAGLGLPVGLGVDINVMDGKWTENMMLKDTPKLDLSASYSVEIDDYGVSVNNGDGCYGVDWSIGMSNQLEFDYGSHTKTLWTIGSPTIVAGCFGIELQSMPSSTSSSSETVSTVATSKTVTSTTLKSTTTLPTSTMPQITTESTTTTTATTTATMTTATMTTATATTATTTTTSAGWTGCTTFPSIQSSDVLTFTASSNAHTSTLYAVARPSAAVPLTPTTSNPDSPGGTAYCNGTTGEWQVSGSQAPVLANANGTCIDTPLNTWSMCMQKCVADTLFYGTNCVGVYWEQNTTTCYFWSSKIITGSGECATYDPDNVAGDVYSLTPTCLNTGTNVLTNGGFETGDMTGWSTQTYGAWPGPQSIGVVGGGYSGNYAFEMQNGAESTSILQQTISGLVSGVQYTFSYIWNSNENQPSSIQCSSSDNSLNQESIAGQLSNDQLGQWQDASTTFTPTTDSITLSCYLAGAAGQNFYMDNIYIGC